MIRLSFVKASKRASTLSVFPFVYSSTTNPHHHTALYPCHTTSRRPINFVPCFTFQSNLGQVKSGPAFYKAPGSSLVAVMVRCLYTKIDTAVIEHAVLSSWDSLFIVVWRWNLVGLRAGERRFMCVGC